jgi:hypothetical protein
LAAAAVARRRAPRNGNDVARNDDDGDGAREPGRERGDRAKTRCPGGERHGDDPVDTNAAMNAGGGAKGTI